MFKSISTVTAFSVAKKTILSGLVLYCVIATVLLLRLNPRPLLIGIDQYGTRVIPDSEAAKVKEELLKQERQNFVKKFLNLLYNYDDKNFLDKITTCGDAMSRELWDTKVQEFTRIAGDLKHETLVQSAEFPETRALDDWNYQADVIIHVQRKLTDTTVKLRVDVKIRPSARVQNNPYPYEVESYDEQKSN